MKVFFKFRLPAALAAVLFLAGTGVEAQVNGFFELGVVPTADSILVSNSLTYTITVTNLVTIDLSAADTVVSNTLPASVQFVSATPNLFGTVTNYGSVTVFHIGGWGFGGVAQMTMTVEPTAVGLITNMVFVAVPSIYNVTNTAATNVVTQVTNVQPAQADLGVGITVPTTAIITNDSMVYGVSVTNFGPNDAPGVMLTNTLPPGVSLLGVLPRLPVYSAIGSNLVFNLGTVSNGTSTGFQFSIQPTNAGLLNFSASVGAPGVIDPNPANNSASNSIIITNYLPGTLTASVTSTQTYNPQNGLVEQSITVSNAGLTSVPAARLVVTGLAGQQLYNNVGTNSGNPFVVFAPGLAAGQTVSLLLQFFAANYFTLTNSQLQAFAVPVPNLSPPPVSSASPALVITRVFPLANGKMLLEFPSIPGRTYTVVYSTNALFSNAMIAPPSFVAPVTPMQWVDYGPPTTASLPAAAPARFYRVILNP
jgi:uncharacterized repeat protein (TIGR01451 family)